MQGIGERGADGEGIWMELLNINLGYCFNFEPFEYTMLLKQYK